MRRSVPARKPWRPMRALEILLIAFLLIPDARAMDVYFSPDKRNEQVITDFIDSAKKSLDIAAYSLTLPAVADAIIRAHERGVKVRVFWDRDQSMIKWAQIEKLRAAGVPVKVSKFPGLMHNKFMVIDSCTVELGSFNYTRHAVTPNHENFVIFTDCSVGLKYELYYDEMWRAA